MPVIRDARRNEADTLTRLCQRSKAMWGYDPAFMAMCADALTVEASDIADGRVLVSTDSSDRAVAVAAITAVDAADCCEISLIFVDPPAIGRGHGAALFARLCKLALARGAGLLTVLADPNAADFYRRMGCRETGEAPSDAIPGRHLPTFAYDLSQVGGADE
jgi:N-acetylglutamate synthase-like GNAT family acetyltransferase